MSKEDVAGPTVSPEATLVTATIEAEEGRDIETMGISNAFVQTDLEPDNEGNRPIMKIRQACVDILCQLDSQYKNTLCMRTTNQCYVHVIKAIYRLLVPPMLFYRE